MLGSMCRLIECISESSETITDMMNVTNTIGIVGLTKLQLESHNGTNYKIVELGMIFITMLSSV